jgi:TDG/mug DNA glycosylase family protein
VRRPRAIAAATGHRRRTPVLPDILGPDLAVVFCGSAVGLRSAEVGAYYAGPGNKFWPTLAAIELTPRRLAPDEYATVLDYGIGLTDLTKTEFGADAALSG